MANYVLTRPDVYPVGTSVGAYLPKSRVAAGPPLGEAIETQTVQADGTLTYTTLTDGQIYYLYASVSSVGTWLLIGQPAAAASLPSYTPPTTVTVKRSDCYPVGTSVGIYPAAAKRYGSSPVGTVVATETVASDGSLAFTGLTGETPYVLYASVDGEHRYLSVNPSDFPEIGTLKERLAVRAAAIA